MNTFTGSLAISNSGYPSISRSLSYAVDPSSKSVVVTEQGLSTSWEAITIGDISASAMGVCYFENLSQAETLQLALANDNSQIFAAIPPLGFALLPLKTGTVYARSLANTLTFTSICTAA